MSKKSYLALMYLVCLVCLVKASVTYGYVCENLDWWYDDGGYLDNHKETGTCGGGSPDLWRWVDMDGTKYYCIDGSTITLPNVESHPPGLSCRKQVELHVCSYTQPYILGYNYVQGKQEWVSRRYKYYTPVARCKDVTVPADDSCQSSPSINNGSSDGSSPDPDTGSFTLSQSPPGPYNVGTTSVTLTVTDSIGHSSKCEANVTVVDNAPPIARCKNITVELDADGIATINPDQINNGSFDNCGIGSMALDRNSFTCADIGPNDVTLTVTDTSGNVSSCKATVTVVDNASPLPIMSPGYSVEVYATLGNLGNMSFDPQGNLYIANGVNDNPGYIRVIEHGSRTVRNIGTPLYDPDGVLFDARGSFGQPASSVLVSGGNEPNVENSIWSIHPDGSMARLAGSEYGLSNVQALVFDSMGRLLLADQGSMKVFRSYSPDDLSAGLQPLISLYRPFDIAINTNGEIYVGAEGGIYRYSPDGTPLGKLTSEPDYVIGLTFGWDGNLFAMGADDPYLYKFAPDGSYSIIGTFPEDPRIGSEGFSLEFGPDNALYIINSKKNTIWRVTSELEPAAGSFVEFQAIPTDGATNWESFTINGETYLAVASSYNSSTHNIDARIYKWNGSSFVEFQTIPASGGSDWESFTINGETYLAIANCSSDTNYNVNSYIYKWNGSSFVEFQAIPTTGAQDWESFTINGETYLAVANHETGFGSNWTVNSRIYKWNGNSFVEFQTILTTGACDWESFTINGETYLALACSYNGSTWDIDSRIYKWNGNSFVQIQAIPTRCGVDWEHFIINGETYLAVANRESNGNKNVDSKIYKWNGSSFVEIQAIPTNGASDWESFTINGETYLAVANYHNGSTVNIDSRIYKWNGSSFVEFQAIPTNCARDWERFTINGETYLAVANQNNGSNYNIDSRIYRFSQTSQQNLVLWNKLGSNEEVLNSSVGPGLKFSTDGDREYVPGRFGNCVTIKGSYGTAYRVHNLVLNNVSNVINPDKGCIEFWYYQIEPPVAYKQGVYRFFNGAYGLDSEIGFHAYDNTWTGRPVHIGFSLRFGGPGPWREVWYDIANISNNTWVHLAASWDRNGINNSSDTIRLYVNGNPVAATSYNDWGNTVGQQADICGGNDNCAGKFYMDNLKIWNYAKNDFSDRFREDGGLPTLIELDQFGADSKNDRILLTWNTLSEIDTVGFNLWRSESKNGSYTKINLTPIEAVGGPALNADYCFPDKTAKPGVTYYYKLEDIDTNGILTLHGPVSAATPPASPIIPIKSIADYYPLGWFNMYSKPAWPPVYGLSYSWWPYYPYP